MAYSSDPALLVLHALRVKGFASADAVGAVYGLAPAAVDESLGQLADGDLVVHREGRVTGWALTAAGREQHRRLVQAEVDAAGLRSEVHDAYRRFLALNGELLALCTAWQMRDRPGADPVPNDHHDRAHDEGVLQRLDTVHEGVRPICNDLATCLDRFGHYEPRLNGARERVHRGQLEWLTRPLIDSYHSVWFELHEDLLVTLGIERKEGDS